MAVNFNHNPGKGAQCITSTKADEAIHRNRFSSHSIQTTGNVFVSNKMKPTADTSSADWAKLTAPAFGNMYVLEVPVNWLVCTADADICSYVSGNM